MSDSFRTTRRIEWADTDAAGIAHFTTFFRFMEEAEHEMLRERGLSVHAAEGDFRISWPRVSVRCDFSSPVRFEDVVDIDVYVLRRGEKSVTYGFDFSRESKPIAHGEITAVCCRVHPNVAPKSIPVPSWFASKLPAARES